MLPLFPENSLATSFVVTVWIGIAVMCLINRRLGWPVSGLVIPGLLAPVFMAKPMAGMVIMTEAVLTYSLVKGSAWLMPRVLGCAEWFGRDRFFAMLLFSVPVRIVMEYWMMPDFIMPGLQDFAGFGKQTFDATGIGLVVVPLMANQLWKPGLRRGLLNGAVTIAVTYLIIDFILIPWTNFDFNNLSLVLDALNTRVTDSPKSYIILLSTAFIASQINLLYGWDFGGILFPGLLALAVFDPLRLLTTLAEAVFLFFAGTFVLQLPYFKNRGVEGSARTLLFFNLAFFYRLLTGHVMQRLNPETSGNDFLALGFLIATMLAMRASERSSGLRLFRAIGQISLIGATAGLLLSFGLTQLRINDTDPLSITHGMLSRASPAGSPVSSCRDTGKASSSALPLLVEKTDLATYLQRQASKDLAFFGAAHSESYVAPSSHEMSWWQQQVLQPLMVNVLGASSSHPPLKELDAIRQRAAQGGWVLSVLQPATMAALQVVLHEDTARSRCHRGVFVFSTQPQSQTGLAVPKPLQERGAVEAGVKLFADLHAAALFIPSAHPLSNRDGSALWDSMATYPNFYTLAVESWLRASKAADVTVVEVRVMDDREIEVGTHESKSPEPHLGDDVVWRSDEGIPQQRSTDAMSKRLRSYFQSQDMRFPEGTRPLDNTASHPPSFSIAKLAARFERTQAMSLSLHPTAIRYLLGITEPSFWETQWLRYHSEEASPKAGIGTEAAVDLAHCPKPIQQRIARLLTSFDLTRLDELQNVDAGMALSFDKASASQNLRFRLPRFHCQEILPLAGFWSPQGLNPMVARMEEKAEHKTL